MQTITSSAQLKEAIQNLEVEQAIKGQALKQQFRLTYESLKPVNLFLSAMNDITQSPNVMDNLLGTSAGLVSGFLSKKIFVGTSGNLFRKLVGSFLQFGVSNLVANHPGAIRTLGQFVLQILGHKKNNSDSEDEE
jgi:hypothetical protein